MSERFYSFKREAPVKKAGVIAAAFIAVGVLSLFAFNLWSSYTHKLDERVYTSLLNVRLVENSITRTIESLESTLFAIMARLPESNDFSGAQGLLVEDVLKQHIEFSPHIRQLAVAEDGHVLLNTKIGDQGTIDFSWLGLADPSNRSNQVEIGKQVPLRFLPVEEGVLMPSPHLPLIPFMLESKEDEYSKQVVAALNISYMERFFNDLDLGDDEEYALIKLNGEILLSSQKLESHELMTKAVDELLSSGQREIVKHRKKDLLSDTLTVRLSNKYPVAVSILLRQDHTLAVWLVENRTFIGAISIACVFIIFSILVLIKHYLQLVRLEGKVNVLSSALHQAPLAVIITDQDHNICYVNPGFSATFGFQLEESLGKKPDALIGLSALGQEESVFNRHFLTNDLWDKSDEELPWVGEQYALTRHRGVIPVSVLLSAATCDQKKYSYNVAILSDISLQRASVEHIKLLSEVVEQSPVAAIITDVSGNIEYVNTKFETLTGYGRDEVLGKNPKILKSGETSKKEYGNLWRTISSGGVWNGEFNNVAKSGKRYWESACISGVRNTQGEITHYVGIKEDITERKLNDKKLRVASTVFESTSEGMMVTNAEKVIQTVNSAFCDVTGYQQEDVIGLTPTLLASGRHDDAFYQTMYTSLSLRGHWEGEIWNRRKNGEVYPLWVSISVIYDAQERVEGYVSLFRDITQRKENEDRIFYQANFDPLTALPNRNLFNDRLKSAMEASKRYKNKFALLFIDLDRFKNVNDTLGHTIGDLLLESVAYRLKSDIRDVDTCARLGGDEFAIILPDIKEPAVAEVIANKLVQSMATPFLVRGHDVFISSSIGITIFPDDGADSEILIRNADVAMYRAKENGRNSIQFFTFELTERAKERHKLESAMRKAISYHEFELYYQPIVDLNSGHIVSCEALIRWNSSQLGVVSPAAFIPLAEEVGLMLPIGEWVIREACLQAKRWLQAGIQPPKVSINLSVQQFLRGNVAEEISSVLKEFGLSGSLFSFEITESLLASDQQSINNQLSLLHALGCDISIDDFGTGYSSLNYLRKFPVTILKIDRVFIEHIVNDEADRSLVSAMFAMAKGLNMKVIVEGVESEEQVRVLKKMGCENIQGYIYSKPLPQEKFITLFTLNKQQPYV